MSFRDFGLMVLVCLTWAAGNVVSKYVVSVLDVPPLFYAAARFAVVALTLAPWLFPAPRPVGRLVAVGLLMGAVNFGAVFVGLQQATPSTAAIVLQLSMPMSVLLSMALLGERVRPRRVFGMALTFAGVMLVMWDPHGLAISTGLMFVALAAFAGSLGSVLMKGLRGVGPLQYQAWVGLTSIGPLIVLSALVEPGQVAKGIAAGRPFAASLGFAAIVVSVWGHSKFFVLVQRYEANLISALTLMNPLFTIGLSVLIMHDRIGGRMAIGATLALLGVLVIVVRGNQLLAMLQAVGGKPERPRGVDPTPFIAAEPGADAAREQIFANPGERPPAARRSPAFEPDT